MTIIFQKLIDEIGPILSGCNKVSLETKILSSVWVLSNQESFRGIADRFGLEKGQLHRIFIEFCESVSSINEKYITWPSAPRAEVIMKSFEETSSIPNVIGCIDGSYINLSGQATECRASYINRKGNSSMQLQAVCDHEMKFIDVYTGWPGSVHDSRVFKASPLFNYLEQNGIVNDGHILGDSAYPLQNYLLTPYRDNGHLNNYQKRYNFLQSSCRSVIERTFALLKGKFRRLKYLDMHKIEKVPDVIMAACVLHNFIREHESSCEVESDPEDSDMSFNDPCNSQGQNEKSCTKRDRIANLL
ncbi:protein ANTAGONIST OF LIKE HETEROCHROMATIN PROTEIN 1-like [Pecten maximus]|uniref:protein ANTAGONIST OF LIKE HETEROCHROMATIN PROTEIN 1-like n=1 Tax=Pecten maximus TaxID=6579 RepID=UPI001457FB85|nr:protein ANTAGONIST OF LIKE HETEROCHROMATIN PROTEIN 1-like [Pecten maximus]